MYALLLAIALFPTYAFAAPRTYAELTDMAVQLINAAIGVALIAGIVVFFYGTSNSMWSITKGDPKRMRDQLLWGVVALFVMFSVWGILSLLRNTLFGSGAYNFGSGKSVTCDSIDDCPIPE